MKLLSIFFALLGALMQLSGQQNGTSQLKLEPHKAVKNEEPTDFEIFISTDTAADKSHRTFIPQSLEVTPFTPPPPPLVKRLPFVRVDATNIYTSKNSRTITLQRGAPSTEPDLPPPPPAPPHVEPRDPTPEEIAKQIGYHRHNYSLGATIYDHRISHINWTDPETLVRYEAVCGFDIGLLAGIGGFIYDGEDYSLFLMHSHFDTTWERRLTKHWQLDVPEVNPGEILITQGDTKNQIAAVPMTVIKEIIAAETPRLLVYQAKMNTYFAAAAAWNAAHPPIPRDETFILRPHRGSHYLPGAKQLLRIKP